ncbi:sensor domain-containing protein [Aquibacillus saliphilus]|uniref:sensor domain-containing protein n=1 Tax=Aquibacillus saliphilus TaxID=1909422 RepID=UPI001CEFFCF7|nr:diguanylate cyclase [Aquibacillus saliphilus]
MNLKIHHMHENQIEWIKQFAGLMTDCIFLMKVSKDQNTSTFTYEFINDAGMELARLTQKNIGKTLMESNSKSQAEYLEEKYQDVLKTNQLVNYSDSVVLSNGHFKAKSRLIPVRNDQNEITHILSITINLTHLALQSNDIKYLNRLFASFVENAEEGLALVDLNGTFLMANESFYKLFKYKKSEIIDYSYQEFQPQINIKEYIDNLSKGKRVLKEETTYLDKFGHLINVTVTFNPIADESGNYVAFAGIFENITDKLKTKHELSVAQERYQLIAESMQDLIEILDIDGHIRYASPSHEYILGYSSDEFINKSKFNFIHKDDVEEIKHQYKKLQIEKTSLRLEFRMVKKTNNIIWVEDNIEPIIGGEGEITRVVASSRDITKRKLAEEKLKQLAYTDFLTSLPNRRIFEEVSQKAMDEVDRQALNRMAILYLDGDKFKKVNDKYGHDVGDQFLIAVADRLREIVGEKEIISRIGGDEFAVLLPQITDDQEIEFMANRILQKMKEKFFVGKDSFHLSFSIGSSIYPDDGDEVQAIMKNADKALYEAKCLGRNRYVRYKNEKIVDAQP